MRIIPAILTNQRREADEWLQQIQAAGKFERVQVDFVDGEYANNLTIKPAECDLTRHLNLMYDAHLMVVEKNVAAYVNEAEKVGFDRIIVQVESVSAPEKYKGLAIEAHSPAEAIEAYLPNLEAIVVVAVEPGFGGQPFDDRAVRLVKTFNDLRKFNNFQYKICVDGGVYQEHLQVLADAGADEVAVGIKRALEW
jgi:ribulose-phosphate 3-epimerase